MVDPQYRIERPFSKPLSEPVGSVKAEPVGCPWVRLGAALGRLWGWLRGLDRSDLGDLIAIAIPVGLSVFYTVKFWG